MDIKSIHDILEFKITYFDVDNKIKIYYDIDKNIIIDYYIDNNKININGTNLISVHIIRLIKYKYNEITFDNLIDMLLYLKIILINPYNYCTFCGNSIISNVIHYCMNINCMNNKYSLFDNTVCDYYNRDNNVFNFIVESAVAGLQHPKKNLAYLPLPPFINNIDELIDIIPKSYMINDFKELYQLLKKNITDYEIYEFLGKPFYSFIKFSIMSTNMELITNNDHTIPNENIIHLDIIHSQEIEHKFHPIENLFFHGSNIDSWYSILRNGIKNMSNTSLMRAGASYGPGVYLSSNYGLSFCYSKINSHFKTHVTGIVQILNPEKNAKITNEIVVVSDDTKILLRSIIINKGKLINTDKINMYYIKDKISITKKNNTDILKICNKRLDKELEIIHKKKIDKFIYNNSIIDNNYIKWNTSILNCSIDKLNFKLSFIFSVKYPLEPPIIYFTSYYNSINNSIFNNDGIILYDKISPKYWSSAQKIYDIIIDILEIMDKIKFENKIINNNSSVIEILQNYTNLIKQKNFI
jgi:ubiquitin-protein ligase